jgi:hypothetical protein
MIKIEDYIFNIEKLFSMQNDIDKKFIQGLYHELLGELRSIPHINPANYTFVFNTLYYGGFLINKTQFDREKVFESLDV